MPVTTPKQFAAMLDAAQQGNHAYPAITVTSLPTITGALEAFAESKSDGINQVSTGGEEFASGNGIKGMEAGVVGCEEDGHDTSGVANEKLYTTPEDMLAVYEALPEKVIGTFGYGVIKMNIDTDTQYAFTRPIVDHMLNNYVGVLTFAGEANDTICPPQLR
jgi:fructose/tagatose bisphosphate aldolase